ncbi:hypothetical protein B0T13DRAFT_21217 [Neurospora crassa]|nr:hypothetical protein B0T13DRAFT_21217 [Neurospora crassa]
MIPKDSLQTPGSRALFDKPSNLICRNRDRTRMGCVFAPYFTELSTVILEEPLWRKADGGNGFNEPLLVSSKRCLILVRQNPLFVPSAHHDTCCSGSSECQRSPKDTTLAGEIGSDQGISDNGDSDTARLVAAAAFSTAATTTTSNKPPSKQHPPPPPTFSSRCTISSTCLWCGRSPMPCIRTSGTRVRMRAKLPEAFADHLLKRP